MGIVLDPTKRGPTHPTEEILEEYVLHHLSEQLAAQVEEHLLICHSCQDAVAETEEFVSALKLAGRHPDLAHNPAPALRQARRGWRNSLEALPGFAINGTGMAAVVVLALLALLKFQKDPQAPLVPVAVSLSSLRGANPVSPAPAGKPLQLNIESPDLAPDLVSGTQYRVEVVDATGNPVWKGTVTEAGGKLVTSMSKPLSNGMYWVRLYGADSELLRDFGMSAR